MKPLVTCLALLLTGSVSAAQYSSFNWLNTVGVNAGSGSISFKGKDSKNQSVWKINGFYNMKLSEHFSIETGLSFANDLDDLECKYNQDDYVVKCVNKDLYADKFEYRAIYIAARAQVALSKRNSLYGKIGANYFDYDLRLFQGANIDDNSLGWQSEIGWQYQWDNGLGIQAGLQYSDAGDVELNTTHLGISYSF